MTNLSDYPKQTFVRTFDIEAISVPIVYNKYGDHDPNGMLYVLRKDSERIQRKAEEYFEMDPPQPYREVSRLLSEPMQEMKFTLISIIALADERLCTFRGCGMMF